MRHLRPISALTAIAAILVACSSPAASSGGQNSQGAGASQAASQGAGASQGASQGAGASQPAASSGGGGGGGGGANGSVTYQITGDYTASGELPFLSTTGLSVFDGTGWAASFAELTGANIVIQLNTHPTSGIFSFGDGTVAVVAVEGNGCTFNFTKNDSTGLAGSVECHGTQLVTDTSGALGKVDVSAHWDAHP